MDVLDTSAQNLKIEETTTKQSVCTFPARLHNSSNRSSVMQNI